MTQLVSGHNDSRESPGVLNDGHGVDLLQSLVHDACAADVGEPSGAAITLAEAAFPPTHVQSEREMMS